MAIEYWRPGNPIPPGPLGFDTETAMIDFKRPGWRPPRPVIASLAGEGWARLLHAEYLPALVRALPTDTTLVAHNAAFDFWVVHEALPEPERERWWTLAERMECTMLLDMLVRLAGGRLPGRQNPRDELLPPRSLKVCVAAFFGAELDKSLRCNFGRLLTGGPALTHDEEQYALDDATWARALYLELEKRARLAEARVSPKLYPKTFRGRFGTLTSRIQTRAAIALDQIRRNGIRIDRECLETHAEDLVRLQGEAADVLTELDCLVPEYRDCTKSEPPPGATVHEVVVRGKKKQKWVKRWKVSEGRLRDRLLKAVREVDPGYNPKLTASGEISLRREDWDAYALQCPLVFAFVQYKRSEKFLKTFVRAYREAALVYPQYMPLVRSGRTSCRRPNLQQVPKRKGSLRDIFVPDDVFWELDYKAIELSAVAQVCLHRYGRSKLAEELRRTRAGEVSDPHARVQELMAARGHEIDRVTAKMANFGFAGGMGWRTFRKHLKTLAGVEIDEALAETLRDTWLEAYPEFQLYLADDRIAPGAGWEYHDGEAPRRPGAWERRQIWCDPEHPAHDALRAYIGQDEPPTWVGWDMLMGRVAVVPTGRVRGRVTYTVERNGPFQGLAADGAKLGLFALVRAGFNIRTFVHDSVLIDGGDPEACAQVMLREMAHVIPAVPVGVNVKGPMRHWGEDAPERTVWLT